MNTIFFGLKRAYHGTLRLTRRTLKDLGLTAARFDLLYAIEIRGTYGIAQTALRRALGVSAPTVSRMLGALERLGIVVRSREVGDRRQRRVMLTRAGRARLRRATWLFIGTGQVQLAIDSALGGKRWTDETHCFFAMWSFESTLASIRDSFGDSATLHYPWHPDD